MTGWTKTDYPFVEQVADAFAEQVAPHVTAILDNSGIDRDDMRRDRALAMMAGAADDDDTFRWLAAQWRDYNDNDLMLALMRNPRCPVDVLAGLARSKYLIVAEKACADERLPETELEHLAAGWWGQRAGVAFNLSAPASVLAKLAADSSSLVRARVARHPLLPPAVREALKADPHEAVRAMAANPDMTVRELLDLNLPPCPWGES